MKTVVICAVLAAFIFGSTPPFERLLLKNSSFPLQIGAFSRLLPAVVLAFIWVLLSQNTSQLTSMNLKEWSAFGFLGIMNSLIGPYLLFVAYREAKGNVSIIGPLLGLFPLFSCLGGVVLLGESISILQGIGIGMIILGAILVSFH